MASFLKITEPEQPLIVLSVSLREAEQLLGTIKRDAELNSNWFLVNMLSEALNDGIRECTSKMGIPNRFVRED